MASTTSSKPTLVFVPGSWHGPEVWDKMVALLEPRGFKCVQITLPTTTSDPAKGFTEDVHAIRDAVVAEIDQKRNVVLIVHSYGGAVGASAIQGLTRFREGANPSDPAVIGIFMMATGFMVAGKTFLDHSGGKPPPIWEMDLETGFSKLTVDARQLFYHDLPEEEGKLWVERLLKQSSRSFTEGADVAYAGWTEVPVWYLATVDDQALPIAAQRFFVDGAKKESKNPVTLTEIATSHSPMLSKPESSVETLLEAIASFGA